MVILLGFWLRSALQRVIKMIPAHSRGSGSTIDSFMSCVTMRDLPCPSAGRGID